MKLIWSNAAAALALMIATPAAYADNCLYAGKEYSPGAARDGQVCDKRGDWYEPRGGASSGGWSGNYTGSGGSDGVIYSSGGGGGRLQTEPDLPKQQK